MVWMYSAIGGCYANSQGAGDLQQHLRLKWSEYAAARPDTQQMHAHISVYTAICNLVTLLSLNMTVAVADLALHAHPRACTMHLNGAYSTSS